MVFLCSYPVFSQGNLRSYYAIDTTLITYEIASLFLSLSRVRTLLVKTVRPIALASTLIKEWCLLIKFESSFRTSDFQFGFMPGLSATLCTGVVKNVISHYMQRGSSVFLCFLDASKAFDTVCHSTLFNKLIGRDIPHLVIRFLYRWYSDQEFIGTNLMFPMVLDRVESSLPLFSLFILIHSSSSFP